MDRKEAADLLDNLIGMVEDSHGADYDTALRMGVEALSAQPDHSGDVNGKVDPIDRRAAIEAIRTKYCSSDFMDDGVIDAFAEIIQDLPSAQPEQKWIPCSERLPENGHYYLWCSDMGNVQSDYYWNGFENGMKYGYNIAAWMPLPKPYKEEQE